MRSPQHRHFTPGKSLGKGNSGEPASPLRDVPNRLSRPALRSTARRSRTDSLWLARRQCAAWTTYPPGRSVRLPFTAPACLTQSVLGLGGSLRKRHGAGRPARTVLVYRSGGFSDVKERPGILSGSAGRVGEEESTGGSMVGIPPRGRPYGRCGGRDSPALSLDSRQPKGPSAEQLLSARPHRTVGFRPLMVRRFSTAVKEIADRAAPRAATESSPRPSRSTSFVGRWACPVHSANRRASLKTNAWRWGDRPSRYRKLEAIPCQDEPDSPPGAAWTTATAGHAPTPAC